SSGTLKETNITNLLDEMIKLSASGLHKLGVSDLEIRYVQTGLKLRLDRRLTGAVWQRNIFDKLCTKHKLDTKTAVKTMFRQYIHNQDSGLPVANWSLEI